MAQNGSSIVCPAVWQVIYSLVCESSDLLTLPLLNCDWQAESREIDISAPDGSARSGISGNDNLKPSGTPIECVYKRIEFASCWAGVNDGLGGQPSRCVYRADLILGK